MLGRVTTLSHQPRAGYSCWARAMITIVVIACVAVIAMVAAASFEDERTQTSLGCGPKARPIRTHTEDYENQERTRKVVAREDSRQFPLYSL